MIVETEHKIIEVLWSPNVGPHETRVIGATVFGRYAVHRQVGSLGQYLEGWTITHLASGAAVWKVKSEENAIEIAAWLEEAQPLPEEDDVAALRVWAQSYPEARAEVSSALAERAPFWRAPEP